MGERHPVSGGWRYLVIGKSEVRGKIYEVRRRLLLIIVGDTHANAFASKNTNC